MTKKEFLMRIANGKEDILQIFLKELKDTKLDYCVIGGLAVNCYAEPVVSLDLDIVVAADIEAGGDTEVVVAVPADTEAVQDSIGAAVAHTVWATASRHKPASLCFPGQLRRRPPADTALSAASR